MLIPQTSAPCFGPKVAPIICQKNPSGTHNLSELKSENTKQFWTGKKGRARGSWVFGGSISQPFAWGMLATFSQQGRREPIVEFC